MKKNLLMEMRKQSGLLLKEEEISQVKTMNAESRIIGAFGELLRELHWIKIDAERKIGIRPGMGMGYSPSFEDSEANKNVNKAKLYKIAMDKLAIVEAEIKKTFMEEVEEDKKTVVIVKKDDDDGEES